MNWEASGTPATTLEQTGQTTGWFTHCGAIASSAVDRTSTGDSSCRVIAEALGDRAALVATIPSLSGGELGDTAGSAPPAARRPGFHSSSPRHWAKRRTAATAAMLPTTRAETY